MPFRCYLLGHVGTRRSLRRRRDGGYGAFTGLRVRITEPAGQQVMSFVVILGYATLGNDAA